MANKENGFTFLEMLLVLSVVAVLTAVILPIGDRFITKQSEEEALYTFIATIHHAQAYALAHETYTAVRFRNSGKSYSMFAPSTETYSTIDFPDTMYWVSGNHRISAVEFHPNGHIVNPGTIILRTSTGDKRLTLQLQHGRVLVYD
ncbi:prepilin-type N-terminal cleavage/methylation domain-containing protein [Sporosarcina sp. ACRSL]|uniref:prepilin-type N-terminal cleavage/methylation domain-containing protein n=1 Tax=Sporosarcina sp. ACRSL TaxID=2918215 RepID=UPI001EF475C0|nr:prepilin-type N-terminal cleavage/methylation domain-containing protein [Sporosarcina sp. ACRSL]MCG7345144.1 prepilin-type N-terminal cleavage/methylation domain-containing protein [Sporosarcina sp. ACRSL]